MDPSAWSRFYALALERMRDGMVAPYLPALRAAVREGFLDREDLRSAVYEGGRSALRRAVAYARDHLPEGAPLSVYLPLLEKAERLGWLPPGETQELALQAIAIQHE